MTKMATRKSHSVYPFSRKRALIPFERSFTAEEFERVKLGVIPQEMEDHWFIFFESRHQNIYFVRSWTGFCAYVVRIEEKNNIARITEAWASCQFGSADAQYHAEILTMVIENVLLNPELVDITLPLK
jgi:hypothetical protein